MGEEMSARYSILQGKVQLYKRPDTISWHCSTSIGGKQHRASTKKEDLDQASSFAEDWYLGLRGLNKRGELEQYLEAKAEKTFREAAERFLREFPVMTEGRRSPIYLKGHERRVRKHLLRFFGDKRLSEVTSGLVNEYRLHRIEQGKANDKPIARNTMHQEIVVLRQTLKLAIRYGWLKYLPDLSQPYRNNSKISHRAWFSPEEYRQLYTATRRRAKNPAREDFRWENEQLHDFVLFMANTGLRPDEALRLEHRDASIVDDDDSGETILEIEVRGKRGVGYCKSTANAVPVYQRLVKRNNPKPTERVFPT
jgi:integrase